MRKPKQGKDLETIFPEIAAEWDYSKNEGFRPSDFSYGSNHRAFWICRNGHSYSSTIKSRTSKQARCPICRQRLKSSFPEQALYFYVKKAFPDAINRDRNVLGDGTELDVYVPSIRMAVEYDGSKWHGDDKLGRERRKYLLCKEKGISLIRIKENRNHWQDDLGISDYIVRCIPGRKDFYYLTVAVMTVLDIMGDIDFAELFSTSNYPKFPTQFPTFGLDSSDPFPALTFDSGILLNNVFPTPVLVPTLKTDVDVARDRLAILETYYGEIDGHNLETVYPEIAKEWHPEKNGRLKPNMFSPACCDKVWWLCPNGHSYQAAVSERTRRNGGCPYCYGRYALTGENDFATVHPELLEEWDWEANRKAGLDPHKLKPMSDAVAHWICSKCGRKWTARIKTRSKGHGCWVCANPLRNRDAAKPVYVYDGNKRLVAKYRSIAEASKETGVARANICRACKHKYHPNQKGYFFSYENLDK